MTVEAVTITPIKGETPDWEPTFCLQFSDGVSLGRFLSTLAVGFKEGQLSFGDFSIKPIEGTEGFAVLGNTGPESKPRILELASLATKNPTVGEMYEG